LAGNGSLTPDILQSCCLKGFWFSFVSCCKTTQIKNTHFCEFELPRAVQAGLGAKPSPISFLCLFEPP